MVPEMVECSYVADKRVRPAHFKRMLQFLRNTFTKPRITVMR